MKISWFKTVITPPVGTKVSGYRMEDVSLSVWSDLLMTGLLMDDGQNKVLLVSFDLLCMDVEYIRKFRQECGEILGIPPEAVMLTFSHTHGGPQINTEAGYPGYLNTKYLLFLEKALLAECRKIAAEPGMDVLLYFYSLTVDENKNRRVVSADNYAAFLPHRAELRDIAGGFTDQELGSLMFFPADPEKDRFPAYVIGNYAAHPLAAHPLGTGARRISADYPDAFRKYVTAETGAECMFVNGAAGDLIPKKDELGTEAAREMGVHLGEGILRGLLDATRTKQRFLVPDPKVGALCKRIRVPLRPCDRNDPAKLPPRDLGKEEIELEIQCLAVGNTCFVGTPGEWCAELGAEVKWHGAFRKNYIAYCATSYQEYMCPGNFLLQGGYEAKCQHFPGRFSIDMVKAAVDATYELRDRMYPLPEGEEEENCTWVNQFALRPVPMPERQLFRDCRNSPAPEF